MKDTHKVYAFQGAILLTHLAYIAIFFGIMFINEAYIRNFSILIQFSVCVFLIYKTFPYQTIKPFTMFDHSVIFYCATFLLMNVVAIEIYNTFFLPLYLRNIEHRGDILWTH